MRRNAGCTPAATACVAWIVKHGDIWRFCKARSRSDPLLRPKKVISHSRLTLLIRLIKLLLRLGPPPEPQSGSGKGLTPPSTTGLGLGLFLGTGGSLPVRPVMIASMSSTLLAELSTPLRLSVLYLAPDPFPTFGLRPLLPRAFGVAKSCQGSAATPHTSAMGLDTSCLVEGTEAVCGQ